MASAKNEDKNIRDNQHERNKENLIKLLEILYDDIIK